MSLSLARYVFMAALRDKLIILMFVSMALAASIAVFLGSSAIIEQDQFSIVFTAGALRIVGAFGLTLFCVFFVRRSFETKDIEFLLSRPINRIQLVSSYGAAFSLIALLMGLLASAVLYANAFGKMPFYGFSLWSVSLITEYVIVVNIAFFFSMVLSSAAGASMATLGFYLLARMSGQFLGIIDAGKTKAGHANEIMEFTVQVVTILTPRLDLMAQSVWLIYDYTSDIDFVFVILQGLVFCSLVLMATLIDLMRKQF